MQLDYGSSCGIREVNATFDPIDRAVLLNHVKYRFGCGGKVLD